MIKESIVKSTDQKLDQHIKSYNKLDQLIKSLGNRSKTRSLIVPDVLDGSKLRSIDQHIKSLINRSTAEQILRSQNQIKNLINSTTDQESILSRRVVNC